MQSVLARIYESYYENPRDILLFFYYPQKNIQYFMNLRNSDFLCEIILQTVSG